MNITRTIQIATVVALALLAELALGECKGHIEENRQVGLGNGKLLILGAHNPLLQSRALLLALELCALVAHIRIDVAIDNHRLALAEPTADHRSRLGTVARIEQCHQIGIHLLQRAQLATQEASDQIAINRCIEAWKVKVLTLDATCGQRLAQLFDLGRFTGAIDAFENYERHSDFG